MMTDRNAIIGERVRFYRTAQDISQVRMAEELPRKISPQQLAVYESGKSRWPADLLCEVGDFLKIDIRILAGVEDPGEHQGDWEAERYKNILLSMKKKMREMAYAFIDKINEL